MEHNERAALIDAIENALAQVGMPDMYAGARRITALMKKYGPLAEATHSRETLDAYIASLSSQDEDFYQQGIALFSAAPELIAQFISDGVEQAALSQPKKVGPPVRITPQEKRSVIDHISRLYTKGTSIGVAQQLASRRFNYGLRSVQRIWRERKEIAGKPFLSIDDIWKYLSGDGKLPYS